MGYNTAVVRKTSMTNSSAGGEAASLPRLLPLYEPIADDLQRVCQRFDDELFSELPFVNDLCAHIRRYRGKMLRPALVLLSGEAAGKKTDEHITLAAVVELVHMATLVHDDVLDDANVRRRVAALHRREGNQTAVLLGDYLISHAFHLCSALDSQYASRLVGTATNTVCEGEIQQVYHRGRFDLTQTQYLEIISRKTAALTGVCCKLGAYFAGATPEVVTTLEQYGLNLGIAFQITDDVLDIVGAEEKTGKTLGRDLMQQKLTLPVIHCLDHAPRDIRDRLQGMLQAGQADRPALQEMLAVTDSLRFASQTARQYVNAAVEQLAPLSPSDANDALRRLALLIIEREQ
jgi:octaprenyl-diphosphate synthase